MGAIEILFVVQGQFELLAQQLQLLLLQLGHRDFSPSLAGLPQGREDQLRARLVSPRIATYLSRWVLRSQAVAPGRRALDGRPAAGSRLAITSPGAPLHPPRPATASGEGRFAP